VPSLRTSPSNALTGMEMTAIAKKAYQQKLGYPAQIKGGAMSSKTPAQNKKDGWTYRPPGENQEFGSSDKFYERAAQKNKEAPMNVRRYHASK